MAVRVLVVDDSSFFRRRVSEIINSDPRLEVVDIAINGKEAIEKNIKIKPDVITMDVEMPVMDGITAVREIMKAQPTPILMFSSLTHDGAKATLDALDAGALDFLPKKFEDIARNRDEAVSLLQQRVFEISRKRVFLRRPFGGANETQTRIDSASNKARVHTSPIAPSALKKLTVPPIQERNRVVGAKFRATGKKYDITVIGTSTGGPVALQNILTKLPGHYPHPIVLIQHMPATFTAAFAARLNSLCQIQVKEAEDGDLLKPGCAYLAPGGKQMMIDGRVGTEKLRIMDGGDRMNYKPCVDVTFGSAAKVYQAKVLSMVLTGMGADGREGARMLKEAGATIWAQDEESCVVYGMPQAVAKAGISTENLPLDRIAERILVEVGLS